jgi:hypothetical protein
MLIPAGGVLMPLLSLRRSHDFTLILGGFPRVLILVPSGAEMRSQSCPIVAFGNRLDFAENTNGYGKLSLNVLTAKSDLWPGRPAR